MGIFSERQPRRERVEPTISNASPENPSTPLSNPDAWLLDLFGNGESVGPAVTERTAMSVGAVFRCVQLISGVIAGMPLNVYRNVPGKGRVEAQQHRLYPMLHSAPYPGRPMTSFTWRELWGVNFLLWGNHYSIIRYDGAARIIGFEYVAPWKVVVQRQANRTNLYRCTLEDGSVEWVPDEDMLHIPGLSYDGIVGHSVVRMHARQAIGLSNTMLQQMARIHENSARPSGMITLPPDITPDGIKRFEAYFNAAMAGRHNAGKPFVADNGSQWSPFQMSIEDLNTLAALQYTNADIARFFGVPPHLIGEAANTSAWGSGIEQLTIGFRIFTMEPHLQRIEHELNLKLFAGSDAFAAFDRDALLAMDAAAQASIMQTQINSGLLTPNEGRRKLHRPDVSGGDLALVNSTMIALTQAVAPKPPPAAPSKPQPEKPVLADPPDPGQKPSSEEP